MAAAIDGWEAPYAHGVGLVPSAAATAAPEHFPLVNTADHRLPGLVIAGVVGHARGTAAYPMTPEDLELAVERLTPAEAFTGGIGHPNLWTWRDVYLRALREDPGARLVAVFLASPDGAADDPAADPADDAVAGAVPAFREALARAAAH
ncbi:hypothetical protein Xcel_0735 [Xylanimonas cellulosilytica DSM 15894]|uniref:Uncharacterized protein n=2 Tax=Xylanimonas TaxID=186188 RepID=D1BXG4_XYLCX|nr:hypothetical protein Xcel_0735 [Xylanimonas cellulosilytica DSM 15894]